MESIFFLINNFKTKSQDIHEYYGFKTTFVSDLIGFGFGFFV